VLQLSALEDSANLHASTLMPMVHSQMVATAKSMENVAPNTAMAPSANLAAANKIQ
jgi:hypothetical protein